VKRRRLPHFQTRSRSQENSHRLGASARLHQDTVERDSPSSAVTCAQCVSRPEQHNRQRACDPRFRTIIIHSMEFIAGNSCHLHPLRLGASCSSTARNGYRSMHHRQRTYPRPSPTRPWQYQHMISKHSLRHPRLTPSSVTLLLVCSWLSTSATPTPSSGSTA